VQRQPAFFGRVAIEAQQMMAANLAISDSMVERLHSAQGARDAVVRVANDVTTAADSPHRVADAAADIAKIALQTMLVTFSASAEAKRAGEAGRGFAVVAEAVKDLAQKVGQSSKQIAGTVQQLDARIKELALNIRGSRTINGQETFSLAFGRVEDAVSRIASATSKLICTHAPACSSRCGA